MRIRPARAAATFHAVLCIEAAMESGRSVRTVNQGVLDFAPSLWWRRLAWTLTPASFASLERQVSESGLNVSEFFAILADKKAPTVLSYLESVRQIAASRPIRA